MIQPDPESPAPTIETEQPGSRTPRRLIWLLIGAAVVIVTLAVTLILVLVGGGSDGDSLIGYGQQPVDVGNKLGGCVSVKQIGHGRSGVARCVGAEGDFAAVETADNADEQSFSVALLKDNDAGECAVVLKGVIILAQTESDLVEVVGIPEQFASDHGGYVLCPI